MGKVIWSQKRLLLVIAFLFAVVAHLPTIANPGFFSHDEWQKYDHVKEYGFKDFATSYGRLSPGSEFGYPVRPISFLEQGFASIFMKDAPWVAHGIDVFIHLLCGLLFYKLVVRVSRNQLYALLSLSVYLISPLSIYSTSWLAASVDRMYILFGLCAAHGVVGFCTDGNKVFSNLMIVVFTTTAIFSKETALALIPVLIGFAAYLLFRQDNKFYRHAPIYLLTTTLGAVAIAYLVFRLPAILGTLHGEGVSTYTPSLATIPHNIFAYFCYPFFIRATDMTALSYLPTINFYLAFLLHGLLIIAFARIYGIWSAVAYLAAYFILLVPIISLPMPGAHYLYGSNVAFSLMVGAVWLYVFQLQNKKMLVKAGLTLTLLLITVRFFQVQRFFYKEGACQRDMVASLNAQILSRHSDRPLKEILIEGEEGARLYIPRKTFFGRSSIGEYKNISIVVAPTDKDVPDSEPLRVKMSASCLMY